LGYASPYVIAGNTEIRLNIGMDIAGCQYNSGCKHWESSFQFDVHWFVPVFLNSYKKNDYKKVLSGKLIKIEWTKAIIVPIARLTPSWLFEDRWNAVNASLFIVSETFVPICGDGEIGEFSIEVLSLKSVNMHSFGAWS
jgi:hypothetical protein